MVWWGIECMGLKDQSPELKLFYFKENFNHIPQSIHRVKSGIEFRGRLLLNMEIEENATRYIVSLFNR
jgi:hypothetical protein